MSRLAATSRAQRVLCALVLSSVAIFAAVTIMTGPAAGGTVVKQAPQSARSEVRLYVFDCGWLRVDDPARFNFKKEELAVLDLADPCFLVLDPRGILMWDTGVVPDSFFKPGDTIATKEYATATKPLQTQMADAGFTPSDVTYLALSHVHWDHTGNASLFAHATWLVRQVERDKIFAHPLPPRTDDSMFEALRAAKTIIITTDEYDVFGDGKVIIKFTPGHTAGHQSLLVKLARTGPVLLTGDLYHYPEESGTKHVPIGDFDPQLTIASRAALDALAKQAGAQIWIQHDLRAFNKLKKVPAFYD